MLEPLDDSENAARYVGGLNFDPVTKRVNIEAFDRGVKDADGLSFTRTGMLAEEQNADDSMIRKIMGSRLAIGKNAVFAVVKVGDAILSLSHFGMKFEFVADPLEEDGAKLANPAHALLLGLPFKGESVGSLNSELAGDLLVRAVNRLFWAHSDKSDEQL